MRFPQPKRVAIIRALHLGDMLCAVPALRAIRSLFPDAHVTLVGLPWARAFAGRFHRYVDAFTEFPGWHGIPERAFDAQRFDAFRREIADRDVDVVLQLHGSGSSINEFVAAIGPRQSAGYFKPGDAVPHPPHYMAWPASGSEIRRLLALAEFLGAVSPASDLEFPFTTDDRRELASVRDVAALTPREYVCVHPGARYLSRRWPAERFAAVARQLAALGLTIVITGTNEEAGVTASVARELEAHARDVTGQLSIGALAALIAGARLVLCNDTGVSHVAAAVGTPSVVIASGSDVSRWSPENTRRHRVVWRDVACRPCDYVECPVGHPCALGVSVDEVLGAALLLLAEGKDEPATA